MVVDDKNLRGESNLWGIKETNFWGIAPLLEEETQASASKARFQKFYG